MEAASRDTLCGWPSDRIDRGMIERPILLEPESDVYAVQTNSDLHLVAKFECCKCPYA